MVDTGMAENREQYLADVFSLVEPEDTDGCSSATLDAIRGVLEPA